ncbi:hypothetical protein Btru_044542 [Bulinus truncatus]|nr:hypothetical protein Btru_044542 [Bulinus truncatus]
MHRDIVNASTDSLDESLIDLSNDDEITQLLNKNESKHSTTCSLNTTEISKNTKEGEFIELLTSRKLIHEASNSFDGNLTDLSYDDFTHGLTKNKSENKSTPSLNASACPTGSFYDLLGDELPDLVARSQIVPAKNNTFCQSFIPVDNSNNIEVSKKHLAERCGTHGKILYFYCVVCHVPACLICKEGTHSSSSGHKTEDIQSLYDKKIPKFTRCLENLKNDTGKLKSDLLKFSIAIATVDEMKINTQEMVDKDLQRNIATLNRMSEILRQKISYRCENEKKRLVESERKYKKYKDVLEEDLSMFETAVSKCDVVAAFYCYRKLRKNEIEQKRMISECCKSTQYQHLQVVYDDEALLQKILQQRELIVDDPGVEVLVVDDPVVEVIVVDDAGVEVLVMDDTGVCSLVRTVMVLQPFNRSKSGISGEGPQQMVKTFDKMI